MNIRVYNGFGSSQWGTPILIRELERHLPEAQVSGIGSVEMRESDQWKSDTSVLVIAGKSVGEFKATLQDKTLRDIANGVFEGRFDYVGICAGAVLACNTIKYRMQPVRSDSIRIQSTGLSFFNIYATGPAREINTLPFSGNSEDIDLITLRSAVDGSFYTSFHWGGPALIPLSPIQEPHSRALSHLKGRSLAMSLQTRYGEGKVTICSHHPEITVENMGAWIRPHCMNERERRRIEGLAKRLDGTAFGRFLEDAGLKPRSPMPRAPNVGVPPSFLYQ